MNLKAIFFMIGAFAFSVSYAQTTIEELRIDTTITGFHFAGDFHGTRVFTKNGPPGLQGMNPSAFSFSIAAGMTASWAKEQFDMLLDLSRVSGYVVTDIIQKDTVLNGRTAYYVSYSETDKNRTYRNYVFNAFVINGEAVVLFTSGDLDNGKYIGKFKKTFYALNF